MDKKLRILIVEDNPGDAVLMEEQLADEGLSFKYERVETEADFRIELDNFKPDVILSDYALPQFDGKKALHISLAKYPFIPFIFVSGFLKDEAAIELIRQGAADYLLKKNISRLGSAVNSALLLRKAREEKARAEEELRKSYNELESRVQERTEELSAANEELSAQQCELQQQNEELTRAKEQLGQLASTIAHELRNPLAAIKMAAFNIKRKAANPDLDKHIDNINKKVAESDQIIQNVLNFSRTKTPRFETLKLIELIKENLGTVSSKYSGGEVEVKESFTCPDDCLIEADAGQMAAVLSNILDNAYQALPEKKGSIEITVSLEGTTNCLIQIKDSGTGIAKEDLEKIFNPFYTTKAKGTGLGLTVCQELVTLHGGKLEIESVLGKGTTVKITLPVKH